MEEDTQVNFPGVAQDIFFARSGQRVLPLFASRDILTWTELVMVLRAKTVAQSLIVDWLSKAPWVSMSSTATCRVGKKSSS